MNMSRKSALYQELEEFQQAQQSSGLSELQATELDSWAEYTLLKIDADVDEEPILLLKMICPSTGFIHVSRVPPDVESAMHRLSVG